MNETNGRNGEKGGIRRLRDLPRDIAPPRDLWPSISAQLGSPSAEMPVAPERARSRLRPTVLQWSALAAVVSALAVGMWLGRSVLPGSDGAPSLPVASNGTAPATAPNSQAGATPAGTPAAGTPAAGTPAAGTPAAGTTKPAGVAPPASDSGQVFASAYVVDPRYTMHREAMVRDLESKLNALPKDSREKVAASLTNIRESMKNIEAELGRDPANALLQELLVNTFRDEMRVLTAVNEASNDAGRDL